MMKAWIVPLLLVSCCALAQSQPSHPVSKIVPPIASQAESADTGRASEASPHERVSDQSPVSVNVFVPNGADGESSSQQGEANAKPNKWADPVTWFTAALVAIGFLQWRVYRRQARIMQNALRPRIILREAYTVRDNGNPVTVTFNIENTGSSEANIVNSKFTIFFTIATGTKRQVRFGGIKEPGEIENAVPIDTKIAAGESYRGTVSALGTWWSPDWCATEDRFGALTEIGSVVGPWHVYLYGMVAYRDSLKITRNMAFYRILEFNSYRFIPFRDSQLEYSDEHA